MEELMRFVAIRAPEKEELDNNDRVVNLSTNTSFQAQINQSPPEKRTEIAKVYTESQDFISDPKSNELGKALSILSVSLDQDLKSDDPARIIARKIISVARELVGDESQFLESEDEADINTSLKTIIDSKAWKELNEAISDSLLALSLYQNRQVRSTINHETVKQLMHFVEKAAEHGVCSVNTEQLLNAIPVIPIIISPEAPAPENDGEEESVDLPNTATVKKVRTINKAAEFLLTLPQAKLQVVTIEEPTEIVPIINRDDEDDSLPKEFVASSQSSTFYTIKASALNELDSEVRDLITSRLDTLDIKDVALATAALRQDEREIYSKSMPISGIHLNGTTLTAANTALVANTEIRDILDVALNPTLPYLPAILGPDKFGALTLPRYGSIGIGDLLVVRQNLKAYSSLDVAHIENILQGESKEREHRRKRLTEETFFTESETELSEERDTQTSERFELRSEVQEEVKETFKFDAGVKVTAKLGPYVELEADARFGYENAKTEGRKKASQYSRETTERASTRFSERVLERRERRLVEEIEELNKHGIDATAADGNIVAIYQWVNKIYEAQVFNYGLRQMYEFFLPESATLYIGSLVSKGLSDGKTPKPPPPFTISPNTLNRSNYKNYAAIYNASSVPAPPEEYVKVDLAQAGGPLDFDSSENGDVAAAFSIQLPDGYEYFGYSLEWRNWNRGDNVDFVVSVSGEFGDPGTVPVWIKGHGIVGWTVWVHIKCRATASFMDDWRMKAWEAMKDSHAQMQREYEEQIAAAAVQQGVEITGRNPLANERIIRDEIQRQCITAFANKSPAGNNGISGSPISLTVDWEQAYKKGLYTRFMHQAFEWENVSYVFYPFFWARKSRWLELFNIEDVDPAFQSFLQSGMTRVIVPVRPGFEGHVEHFRRTGQIWSGGQPPTIGDPDYISIVAELKAQTGAPGDEEPVGDPWDIVMPTPLVALRNGNQLPKWKKNEDDQWIEDNS